MRPADENIKAILLRQHYISEADLRKAQQFVESHNASLVEYLLNEGLVTKDLLGQAIAESIGVPYADLNSLSPSREMVLKIPEEIATRYRLVVFNEDADTVTITSDQPKREQILATLGQYFPGKKFIFTYSLPEDIDAIFVHYRKPLETRFGKIIEAQRRVAPEIIKEIFEDALIYRASDIHFEPQEKELVIRFRIDGVLHEASRIPKIHYENILNRIKVMARLRIDEHFATQDGAIRYPRRGGRSIDMRVSVAPLLDGEKVAVRILAEYVRSLTLADLGLSANDRLLLEHASQKPFGMILVTGPTGSGKTTTLYAVLKTLNRPEVNITTIEDPVEFKLVGANQIQVNPETNLTFANGLRSIVRQDPDVILVGEIRDEETAEIAVNAALTGHLLVSTFHANDAATAIPRLLDMGIEPFLLASTLEIVVSQRLVRKICELCRFSRSVKRSEIERSVANSNQYFGEETVTLYQGKGCKTCSGSGYRGRIAIYEFVVVTPEMKELILTNPPTNQVWELARRQGSHSLFEDGIDKVLNGVTSLEELMRVAPPPVAPQTKRTTKQES